MNRRADRGFTLVELMVAIVLLGVITTVIAGALYFGIKATNNSYTKLDQSTTEQNITRYLTGDVFSAEGVIVVNNNSDTTCGGVANPGLKISSRSPSAMGGSVADTMVVWAVSGNDLVRRTCVKNLGSGVWGAPDTFTVASGITSPSFSKCTNNSCNNRTTITFTFTVLGSEPTCGGNDEVDCRTFTVSAQARGVAS